MDLAMKNYFFSKLSGINYRIATHEGNANRRLASAAPEILFQLHEPYVPEKYKKDFKKLVSIIEKTAKSLPEGVMTPIRIEGIRNRTAAKYIQLLLDIQNHLDVEQRELL